MTENEMSFKDKVRAQEESLARSHPGVEYVILAKKEKNISGDSKRQKEIVVPLVMLLDQAGSTVDLLRKYKIKGCTVEAFKFIPDSEKKGETDERVADIRNEILHQYNTEQAVRQQIEKEQSGVKKKYEERIAKLEAEKASLLKPGKQKADGK